jgi:hypothetical protein
VRRAFFDPFFAVMALAAKHKDILRHELLYLGIDLTNQRAYT